MSRPELPIYFDATMNSAFHACPRKFYWNFIRNKVPLGESIHLIAGGAYAAALHAARTAQFTNTDKKLTTDELMEACLPEFLKAWGDFIAPEGHAKSKHNMLYALEQYFERYHPSDDIIQPLKLSNGKPATEFSFAIPMPIKHPSGEPFLYCGRFDMLGTYSDRVTVLDDKTTGYFVQNWEKMWMMRGQFLGYVWACQQLGYKTNDCLVRGCAIQKTQIKFLDCPITYPQHLIDRWYKELLASITALVWHYENDDWPYDFADACSSYGGCPYMDLCVVGDAEKFMNNYQERTWSPIQLEA